MHVFLNVLVFVGLFQSAQAGGTKPIVAHPVDTKESDFSQKMAGAKKWEDLLVPFQGVLPNNILKEIAASAKDKPFPTIKAQKDGIFLTDPNGGKLQIELGKEGTVFFNGKEWVIRPLASTADEWKRIVLFLEGDKKPKASLLESLLPSALAGAGISPGLALAAHATATGWKAQACGAGEEDLSDELNRTCPLLAVPMRVSAKAGEEEYVPTKLSCPARQGFGTLELVSKNRMGESERIRVTYVDNRATVINVAFADPGSDFETLKQIDFTKERSPIERKYGELVFNRVNFLNQQVCSADQVTRARYFASLEANRSSRKGVQRIHYAPREEVDFEKEESQEAI